MHFWVIQKEKNIYLHNISTVSWSMNTFKNLVQSIIFLSIFYSAFLSLSPVFIWTWAKSSFPQLHKVRQANYFHSSGERWGVLLPSSTLQVQGSVVLLIQTSAASFLVSTKPPLWNQTCYNRCVRLVAGYRHSLFTRTKYMTPIFDWHYNNNMDELLMVTLGSYMNGTRQGTRRKNQSVNYKGSYLDPGGLGAV